jgi:hypothetical protein
MFRRNWESAAGTIIDRREKREGATGSDASLQRWLVEVRPQTGQPFRVELGIPGWGSNFKGPMVGQVVKVLCNPAHTKARFDTSDPQLSYKAERQAQKQQWDEETGGAH